MKHADLIQKMTLAEKAAMLSGRDEWHSHSVERLGIPALTMSDGPSGLRRQAGEGDHLGLNASTPATCIPSASTLANSWDPAVAQAMGAAAGADARAQGVHVLLGPGLNTKRSTLCGRSFEYYSEDPYLAGKLAAAFVRGVQSNGVSACAKHFAVNSQELHRMASDSVLDERTLREIYLTNFEIVIREGQPRSVMTSYNRVNGTYANEHPHLLGDILRGEWGWHGMVVSDWGGGNDFVEGVRAGCCLEMPAAGDDSPCQLVKAVQEGRIDEAIVDERVDQLIDLILTHQCEPVPVDSEAQHARVREAAERCAVLLKNDGGLLPLAADAKVAIIGDFAAQARYQGAGSSMVNAAHVDKTLDLVKKYFPGYIGFARGFERLDQPNAELTTEAVALARKADIILLYIGLPEGFETEGLDRTHMRLPNNQIALMEKLAALNKPVAAVLSCGSGVEMPWIDQVQALVWGGLGGEAAADAMLRVLSGQVNPGGKLSETLPVKYEDNPVSRYYPGDEYTSEYREGIYVGYRYFTTAGKAVRFPFGYGLSYTRFKYENLTVTDKGVTFDLTNIGPVAGDEIAQLYISLPGAKVFRANRELKGFARVSLQPGETKRVEIPFDEYTFRYFNVKTNKFEVEGGTYTVQIGASCVDLKLKGTVQVAGTDAPNPYAGQPVYSWQKCTLDNVPDSEFRALLGFDIPQHKWNRNRPLGLNDCVAQMSYARSPLARKAAKILAGKIDKALANGKPDLNLLFIYNIPFRGMAKMMNGMVSMKMAEDIAEIANGHFFKGAGKLIHHFFHRPKLKMDK